MSIKDALYGATGRKKIGQPEYSFLQDRNKFRCECTITGINYSGMGISTNKKNAQTNAAKDMGEYLVREGLLEPTDIPQLQEGDLEGSGTSNFGPPDANVFAIPNQQTVEYVPPVRVHEPRQPTNYEKYIADTANEVEKSECVDLTAEIHGGWTVNNCKQALNEFLQANRMPAVQYKMESSGPPHAKTFVASIDLFIQQLGIVLKARGEGSNSKIAQSSCALSVVRQLYHKGVLKKCGETISKKKNAADLPATLVQINPDVIQRLDTYLEQVGLNPVKDGFSIASNENRISLVTDQKLASFPVNQGPPKASGLVAFAPPTQNWDPWKGTNIDEGPLATMKLPEISNQILMQEKAKNHNPEIVEKRRSLPVFKYRESILDIVDQNSVVLIKGTTGCGKSTQVCQYLLDHFIHKNQAANFNCIVSQPRRISTISLAERVASERMEDVGMSVGYTVRFESVNPRPYGAILFCTVGCLLRKMEYGLRGVSHLIIDEIHERDVDTDFLLVIIRDMARAFPNLKVILMSATIDTNLFTNYFDTSAVIEIEQRVFEVQYFFLENVLSMIAYEPEIPEKRPKNKKSNNRNQQTNDDGDDDDAGAEKDDRNLNVVYDPEISDAVKYKISIMDEQKIEIGLIEAIVHDIAVNGEPGAILVFLPGMAVIEMCQAALRKNKILGDAAKYIILPLHSQLPSSEQRKVFQNFKDPQRKIILSTNIAETSVTIDDVVYVIDSCRAREASYTSRNNMVHFSTVWASRNSLIQRRGRAGRVKPGFCFHLCTEERYKALEEHRTAEMLRVPLASLALSIKLLRLGSVGDFLEKAIEPPPMDAIVEAEVLLREMNALDKNLELTDLGRVLARLPLKPRDGKALILASALNIGDLMCTITAASCMNTPFVPLQIFHKTLSNCHRRFSGRRLSDHIGLVKVNNEYCRALERNDYEAAAFASKNSLNRIVLGMTREAKLQMRDVLVQKSSFSESSFQPLDVDPDGEDVNLDLLLGLLVYALYPNIAYYRDKRQVFTLEQATALMSKLSVCMPQVNAAKIEFPSPLLVFTDKRRTSVISANTISMITPIHLLLFGSRRIECVAPNLVRLDDMIVLEMDPSDAAKIVALRPAIEALVVKTCINPASLSEPTPEHAQFLDVLRQLCGELAYQAAEITNAPMNQFYSEYQQKRKLAPMNETGPRRQFPQSERPQWRPDQRFHGRGRGGYRGGFRGGNGPRYQGYGGQGGGFGRGGYGGSNRGNGFGSGGNGFGQEDGGFGQGNGGFGQGGSGQQAAYAQARSQAGFGAPPPEFSAGNGNAAYGKPPAETFASPLQKRPYGTANEPPTIKTSPDTPVIPKRPNLSEA
ncbi:unnamed protein product [Bursaphelenchus okinawaensis]|uniref:RNA helicase n=1 Tax=Bursaphelenchus okinawaensis TaxID=465554 RepID=A0A811KQG9_9BILA|nr:unnamed protein product [Bursaphelenchus okinawaensis]CAG9107990.1 unnamed protein product [Bursaphelenchus okinawaensis]